MGYGYGFGVFLLALGLILALAVSDVLSGVDLTMVGWILAVAGVICLLLTFITTTMRARHTTTYVDDAEHRPPLR
jgi:hypothetical protein